MGKGGGMLSTVGCLAAFLASAHWMLAAPPTFLSLVVRTENVSRHCQMFPARCHQNLKAGDFIIWLASKLFYFHAIRFYLKHMVSLDSKYSSVYMQKLDIH